MVWETCAKAFICLALLNHFYPGMDMATGFAVQIMLIILFTVFDKFDTNRHRFIDEDDDMIQYEIQEDDDMDYHLAPEEEFHLAQEDIRG